METIGMYNTMDNTEIKQRVLAMAACLKGLSIASSMMAIAELMAASLLADARQKTDFAVLPYAQRSLEAMKTQVELLMNMMTKE